jgi:pyridoxine kinase
MEQIAAHFSQLDVRFRSIYTGFLGSAEQIETVSHFLDSFASLPDESGEPPLILIDPVMGDDGVLYSTYTHELMCGMRRLSARAQLLTPNLTEACFLTDTPYRDTEKLDVGEAMAFTEELLEKLGEVTAGRIVITGIHLSDGRLANLGKDLDGSLFCVARPREGRSYPGTGDLFASVLLGAILQGDPFEQACELAAAYVGDVIRASSQFPTPERNGVALEPQLWRLARVRSDKP